MSVGAARAVGVRACLWPHGGAQAEREGAPEFHDGNRPLVPLDRVRERVRLVRHGRRRCRSGKSARAASGVEGDEGSPATAGAGDLGAAAPLVAAPSAAAAPASPVFAFFASGSAMCKLGGFWVQKHQMLTLTAEMGSPGRLHARLFHLKQRKALESIELHRWCRCLLVA